MGVYYSAIAPMVQCAKGLAQNPRDPSAVSQWRGANHQVCVSPTCTVLGCTTLMAGFVINEPV